MADFHSYKPEISAELNRVLTHAATRWEHPWAEQFFLDTLEYAQRGRMIRGSVVIQTWKTMSGADKPEIPPAVLTTAACIEIFESALLIHDDIIDRDNLRRGKRSMHTALSTVGKNRSAKNLPTTSVKDAEHLGESLALILGDLLFFFIYQQLSMLPISDRQRLQLIETFSSLALTTGLGQTVDIAAGFNLSVLNHSEIMKMYQDKTASYSFSLPLQFGAILSDQTAASMKKLQQIGTLLGQLYQIADDHKGIFGTTEETGKPAGGDIREGKQTLHRLVALEALSTQDAQRFSKLYGKQSLSEDELQEIRAFFSQQTVLSAITTLTSDLENSLSQELANFDAPDQLLQMLENLWKLAVAPLKLYPRHQTT